MSPRATRRSVGQARRIVVKVGSSSLTKPGGGVDVERVTQLVDVVVRLRELELKKAPSIAESVDWARTLVALQVDDLDEAVVARTLGVVLKHASDTERAVKELGLAR